MAKLSILLTDVLSGEILSVDASSLYMVDEIETKYKRAATDAEKMEAGYINANIDAQVEKLKEELADIKADFNTRIKLLEAQALPHREIAITGQVEEEGQAVRYVHHAPSGKEVLIVEPSEVERLLDGQTNLYKRISFAKMEQEILHPNKSVGELLSESAT